MLVQAKLLQDYSIARSVHLQWTMVAGM